MYVTYDTLKVHAETDFPEQFAKLPPYDKYKPEKLGDHLKLRVGQVRVIGKFTKPYLGPQHVYAVIVGCGFELWTGSTARTAVSPHNVRFDAPFCYLYPRGVPYHSTRDLDIILRFYFESLGESVPLDPKRPYFLQYAQQFRSACTKIAQGLANSTQEIWNTTQASCMFANEEQQFEDDLQRMNASYEAFKVKALTDEVEIEELKHQEQNSEAAKEELEKELQIELAKVKDEAATWKGKYDKLMEDISRRIEAEKSGERN